MMKKGLLLSLLVVAVVCMSVPAGARAPIVESLPDIIIGDAGDVSAGGNHLLRYLNVVELGSPSWITTQNGMGMANLSVYYASYSDQIDAVPGVSKTIPNDASTIIKDCNTTGVIEPLNGAERTALQSPSHTFPPPEKRINFGQSGVEFTWLSLFNTATTSSGLVSIYTETFPGNTQAATHGLQVADFAPGWDAVSTLTIYALEVDGATRLLGKASSLVMSELSTGDRTGSTNTLINATGAELLATWVETPGLLPTVDYDIIPVMSVPGGLGFQTPPDNNTLPVYGEWQSGNGTLPATIIDADEATVGEDHILHLVATLGSNAATALESTGYRVYYAAGAYQHFGGAVVLSDPARGSNPSQLIASVLTPASGADFNLHLYWAVPYDLTEYRDGEILSDFDSVTATGAYGDARDYRVLFGMIDAEAADTDAVWMSNLKVEVVGRPPGRAPHIAWGGDDVPFTDFTQGWQETTKIAIVGGVAWPIGDVEYSPAGDYLNIAPGIGDVGYQETAPRPAGFGVGVRWTAGKLVRFRAHLTSVTDVEQSPMFRILGLIWRGTTPMNITWQDELGSNILAKFEMERLGGVTTGSPGVPKGGEGSIVETYIYTHNGDPLGGAAIGLLGPVLDVYNADTFVDGTGWSPANGSLRMSSFSVEDGI